MHIKTWILAQAEIAGVHGLRSFNAKPFFPVPMQNVSCNAHNAHKAHCSINGNRIRSRKAANLDAEWGLIGRYHRMDHGLIAGYARATESMGVFAARMYGLLVWKALRSRS